MVSPFEEIINRLVEIGFYGYVIPFLISSIIFYAIIKKSKILGEGNILPAVIAIAVAFMIFGYPVIIGFNLAAPLTAFFTQATVFILIFVVGILMASFFYPKLPEFLVKVFTRRTTLWVMIALGIALFVTSGLVSVFWHGITRPTGMPTAPRNIIILVAGIVIFIIMIMIAAATVRGE